MNQFIFPISVGFKFPVSEGILVKLPNYFSRILNSKYEGYLRTLPFEERLFEDPNGFSAMPFRWQEQWIIICGVRVDGFFNRKKTNALIGTDFNPIFPIDTFVDLISKYRILAALPGGPPVAVPVANESHEFFTITMHEIRRLNLQVKAQSEEIMQLLETNSGKDPIEYRVQNIFSTSALISTRLDVHDFHANPQAFASENPKPISIYKKFEKAKHCVRVLANSERVSMRIVGQTFRNLLGYDVFELLPFVILENAIKYSLRDQDVLINFVEYSSRVSVQIESLGPMMGEGEIARAFEPKFRGKNAQSITKGTGTGLHFAKLVCDLHKIDISVKSDQSERFSYGGIPYSTFNVTLSIPAL